MTRILEQRAAALADSGQCSTYLDVQLALHEEGFADTELLFLTRDVREHINSRCLAAIEKARKTFSRRSVPGSTEARQPTKGSREDFWALVAFLIPVFLISTDANRRAFAKKR